jgi:hypothetical protein
MDEMEISEALRTCFGGKELESLEYTIVPRVKEAMPCSREKADSRASRAMFCFFDDPYRKLEYGEDWNCRYSKYDYVSN